MKEIVHLLNCVVKVVAKNMRTSCYFFNHLLFMFQPEVFVLPLVLYVDKTGIEVGVLWFYAILYWKRVEEN